MFIRWQNQNGRQQGQEGFNRPQILGVADGNLVAVGLDIAAEIEGTLPPKPRVGNEFGLGLQTFLRSGGGLAKEFRAVDLKTGSECEYFKIRHPTGLRFDFCQCVAAQIPAENVEFSSERGLRETFFHPQIADNWANNIAWRIHVPNPVLDIGKIHGMLCAGFGTFEN